jgi:hypothetical protein
LLKVPLNITTLTPQPWIGPSVMFSFGSISLSVSGKQVFLFFFTFSHKFYVKLCSKYDS